MAHQLHLEKKKYRQWVKAGLGLTYLRQGLLPFCKDIVKEQHNGFLEDIKQTKNLSSTACGQCSLINLEPDHFKLCIRNRGCPFGQRKCNCLSTSGRKPCPNQVCGALYDKIVKNHGFTPPAPNWKNTGAEKWPSQPWSVAMCFINAPGYEQKTSADDIDCIGLLYLIINNLGFHGYIKCDINGSDVFSKIKEHRNTLFHSSNMEVEEADAIRYIDDMIAVLQDKKTLKHRQDAKEAVEKLMELKQEDFVITTRNEAIVVRDAMESINKTIAEIEQKLKDVPTTGTFQDLESRVTEMESDTSTTETTLEGLDRRVAGLECNVELLQIDVSDLKEEIGSLKKIKCSQQSQSDFIQSKLAFQNSLIDLYRDTFLQVPAMPLMPRRHHCSFSDVYVTPKIAIDEKFKKGENQERLIKTLSDIFTRDGGPSKLIYVVGDAGSGKTSFCKMLVHYWCLAHSEVQTTRDELEFGVNEMKKFDFLFCITLHRCQNIVSIKEMIEKMYSNDLISTLLERESEKILIVLDGLDEWSVTKGASSNQFQTEGLPEIDNFKKYTVVSTTRPWKLEALGISDKEIHHKLNLMGFDNLSEKYMIDKTVRVLNKIFKDDKKPSECEDKLSNPVFKSLKNTPLMFQELVCLWFVGKLNKTSRCALFTDMLGLLFIWNADKKVGLLSEIRERTSTENAIPYINLPQYLLQDTQCESNSFLIYEMSRLAYETQIKRKKGGSLIFDRNVIKHQHISDDVIQGLLRLGILCEGEGLGAPSTTKGEPTFTFLHKTMQEYLSAVFISITFKDTIGTGLVVDNYEFHHRCKKFLEEHFCNYQTLVGVLEQANVFVMLCGLEPNLATHVSKYIHDTVSGDTRIQKYRMGIDVSKIEVVSYLQSLILSCMEEVNESSASHTFYIEDIIFENNTDCSWFFSLLDKRTTSISVEHVRSITVFGSGFSGIHRVVNYLFNCHHLEAIRVYFPYGKCENENIKCISKLIAGNVSTLKAIAVSNILHWSNRYHVLQTLANRIAHMNQLVCIELCNVSVLHDDYKKCCDFLSGTSRLQNLSISLVHCSKGDQHVVDLSGHHQLECLRFDHNICVTKVNTSNLEKLETRVTNKLHFIFNIEIRKIRELTLIGNMCRSVSPIYNYTFTRKLTLLLPTFHNLTILGLKSLTLTDNILQWPHEMKCLKYINCRVIAMKLSTWKSFVDRVSDIPQAVIVYGQFICIYDENLTDFGQIGVKLKGVAGAALHYVKAQEHLFHVEYDNIGAVTITSIK